MSECSEAARRAQCRWVAGGGLRMLRRCSGGVVSQRRAAADAGLERLLAHPCAPPRRPSTVRREWVGQPRCGRRLESAAGRRRGGGSGKQAASRCTRQHASPPWAAPLPAPAHRRQAVLPPPGLAVVGQQVLDAVHKALHLWGSSRGWVGEEPRGGGARARGAAARRRGTRRGAASRPAPCLGRPQRIPSQPSPPSPAAPGCRWRRSPSPASPRCT